VRAAHAPLLLILLAGAAAADAPEPRFEALREGLLSPGRGAREGAEQAARELARTDPAGVAALWDRLDLRGRCLLVRALAAAGTRHAAEVALARAVAPEAEFFRALLDGLAAGGEASLFAPLPEEMPAPRKEAIEELRLRWKLEEELARLKSPSGPTGHYTGQFARVKALGRAVIPILLDITADRARPLPGESAAGPYASIHPEMARFDPQELRGMTAYAFAEVAEKSDAGTIRDLRELYVRYAFEADSFERRAEESPSRFEREELAPSIAFSLYDLGDEEPALAHILSKQQEVAQFDRRRQRPPDGLLWELGYACIRIGRFDEGEGWYGRVLDEENESKAITAYNLACNFSMRAEREPRYRKRFTGLALAYLEHAIRDYNYGDWKWMEADGDLAFIRGEPKYQELLRSLQRKYPEREKGKVPKRSPR
jgi:hypothetical protein